MVLCFVGKGVGYGTGHYLRMLEIKQRLASHSISMDIITQDQPLPKNLSLYSICLLDQRDDAFPNTILEEKQLYKIAIDNRGLGRVQSNLIWDTLPHPKMTVHELKQSIQKVIFKQEFLKIKPKVYKANLQYRRMYPRKNYNTSHILQKKKEQYTYFGQRLFELLYQGENIILYDVTLYHRFLSVWFVAKWKGLPIFSLYLDGKGAERLVQTIQKLVKGEERFITYLRSDVVGAGCNPPQKNKNCNTRS